MRFFEPWLPLLSSRAPLQIQVKSRRVYTNCAVQEFLQISPNFSTFIDGISCSTHSSKSLIFGDKNHHPKKEVTFLGWADFYTHLTFWIFMDNTWLITPRLINNLYFKDIYGPLCRKASRKIGSPYYCLFHVFLKKSLVCFCSWAA